MKLTRLQLDGIVQAWNELVPVGREVTIVLADGSAVRARTVSTAWVLPSRDPAVKIEGQPGAWPLAECIAA